MLQNGNTTQDLATLTTAFSIHAFFSMLKTTKLLLDLFQGSYHCCPWALIAYLHQSFEISLLALLAQHNDNNFVSITLCKGMGAYHIWTRIIEAMDCTIMLSQDLL
jgi:hypothetical protein